KARSGVCVCHNQQCIVSRRIVCRCDHPRNRNGFFSRSGQEWEARSQIFLWFTALCFFSSPPAADLRGGGACFIGRVPRPSDFQCFTLFLLFRLPDGWWISLRGA